MLVRLGFVVLASFAAFTLKRGKGPSKDNGQASKEKNKARGYEHGQKEEEEAEEVKTISGMINSAPSVDDDDDDDMFSEIESLLGGEVDIPIPGDRFDVKERSRYNAHMANNASEMERLRGLVRELEEREVKLEGELLEYYGLKEQETDVTELQKQLKIKTVEVDMLNITISSLQAERKKLQEDVVRGAAAKKELEASRTRIKELQRQIQMEANQTKGQLMLLKQQVMGLKAKEEEVAKKDAEIERKLKKLKDLEVEVLELRRKNKELLYEKRDLMIKLDAAQGKITESDVVSHAREEINNLRHTNEDLTKQVEGLQMNRFSEVEELVYLRWVNACLRFELRNYQIPSGKMSARDLNRTLSPKSQERAKQMMLEYGSERGQGDTDLDSAPSSAPSSPRSEDFDTMSIDSSSSKYSFLSKRPNLMQKLKKWGKSKDDSSYLSSPTRSLTSGSPKRSQKPKGPLESLMIRNAGDGISITTFGKKEQDDMDDANIASSFQLMSKTVEGFADEKYPAYKDRHKLATEREKAVKEKAEQARAQRFGGGYSSALVPPSPRAALPPKLAQIKEKVPAANAESGEHLRAHWKFLKTVVNKLFEFMHEMHPGVQDMACDTFLKIVQKCKRKFVTQQVGENEPFVSELLTNLATTILDLEPHQIHTFYESVGHMIQAESDNTKRDEYLKRLMSLPNQKWAEIIGQAGQSIDILKNQDVIRSVLNILQTNTSVATALGPHFFPQISLIFLDMLTVYRMYSELVSSTIAEGGPYASKSSFVKLLRSIKRETLKLIETFVDKAEDLPHLGKQFVPPMMDPVLGDYARNVPDARESEVLSLFATIINKYKAEMLDDVPRIFEAVFQCTLEMITKNFEDYPEHRLKFFSLLRAIGTHCFKALISLSSQQLKLVIDSINWAFRHTERNIAETGLSLLLEILKNFQASAFQNQFYKTYFLNIEQEIFAVLTDSFHKPGFKLHVLVLQHLFCVVDGLTEPLWDATAVQYQSNAMYVREYTINLLGASFPNMTSAEVTKFVDGLLSSRHDLTSFKNHIRDFLVQSKEFSAQDNKDLYAEEAAAQREKERQRMLAIPGLIAPSELQDEMLDS